MKNATIATSRTRATSDHLIAYRPLPSTWGDVDALHAVRERRSLAASQGLDPSTLEFRAPSEPAPRLTSGQHFAPARGPADPDRSPSRRRPAHPGLLAPLFGVLRGA